MRQLNKHGIPLDIPKHRQEQQKVIRLTPDYFKYKTYATLVGFEDGCNVIATCPVAHPDFKTLKKQGYKVVETWERSDVRNV